MTCGRRRKRDKLAPGRQRKLRGGHYSWPQHPWRIAGEIDNRRFNADRTETAVDHSRNSAIKIRQNMFRPDGREASAAVGAWCGERQAACTQKIESDRVIRRAKPHGCPARQRKS